MLLRGGVDMSAEMDAAVDAALDAYEKRFGDRFPNMELAIQNDDELLRAIKRCMDEGKSAQIIFDIKYDDKDLKY